MKRRRRFCKLQDHHIVPRSRNGDSTEQNLKRVEGSYHRAYHHLFENLTPEEIHQYLNEVWFTNETFINSAQWLQTKKHSI